MELQILNGTPKISDVADLPRQGELGYLVRKSERVGSGSVSQAVRDNAAAQGISPEEYERRQREEFIRRHGMTPEAAKARREEEARQQAARLQAAQKAEAENLARLRAELDRRGVDYPAGAGRNVLVRLLAESQKPSGAIQTIKKVIPAAALLRNGILLWLKTNKPAPGVPEGLAKRLLPGLLSEHEASKVVDNLPRWRNLRRVYQRLETTFVKAGGEAENLRAALREGGGGIAGTSLAGLGEPATATAIAAATAAISAIGALLKSVGQLKVKPTAGSGETLPITPGGSQGGEIYSGGDFSGSGEVLPSPAENEYPGADQDKPKVNWTKIGLISGLGLLGIGGTFWAVRRFSPKKPKGKSNLKGTPRRGKKPRSKSGSGPKRKSNRRQPELLSGVEAISLPY